MRFIKIALLSFSKYIIRYKKPIIFVGLLYIFLVFLITRFYHQKLELLSNSVSEGVVGTFTENDLPLVVTSLLSDGLISIDASGAAKPNLVNSWEVNSSVTSFTFKLNDNLKWVDDSKILAKDLNLQISDVKIDTLDDNTIQFNLADAYSPLPTLLTKPIFKKDSLIGTGPYLISSLEKSQIFVRKVVLKPTKNDLPTVTIRFYPNEKIAKNALQIGEVQSLMGISNIDDSFKEKPFKIISKTNYAGLVAIFYNTKDPILSDRNFRLALRFAAPTIKDAVEAKTTIAPNSWAFNTSVKDFLDNPEQTKVSLEKVKNKGENPIVLTVTTSLKDIGEKIVKAWNDQGISSLLRVESGIPQNFQALLIAQNIPFDPDQYSLWHSTQDLINISKYSSPNQYSPRVDKDLEDGRKTLDQEARKSRYLDFQKYLLDDAPVTPLYFLKYNVVFLKKIESHLQKVLDLQFKDLQLN